ncbi:MAG TPA: hypothetical protein VFS41_06810 [Edaphobacter sp.]|nr:hypothetical protein [Edaphobacter sp.]
MRRLLSIVLLVVFGLPLASPLFALGRESGSNLPACCRRGGSHHCMGMAVASGSTSKTPTLRSPAEHCPYFPGVTTAVRSGWTALPAQESIYAGLVSHPAVVAQTQSMWRISRDRSRQKRGPPSILL